MNKYILCLQYQDSRDLKGMIGTCGGHHGDPEDVETQSNQLVASAMGSHGQTSRWRLQSSVQLLPRMATAVNLSRYP